MAQAHSPSRARGWLSFLSQVKDEIGSDHIPLVSAGVAFYWLLAVFPGIAALISIWALIADPDDIVAQLTGLQQALPPEASAILMGQARGMAASDAAAGYTAVLSIALALWSASSGIKSLMQGVNIAYGQRDERGFFKKALVGLGLTLLIVLGFIAAMAAVIVLPVALSVLPFSDSLKMLVALAPWPILFLAGVLILGVVYRYAPARKPGAWRLFSWGAAAGMGLWLAGSIAFSIYVANFASYNATYGAIGGVIVLLMWLWVSALSVLIGAEVNALLEKQRAEKS